MSKKSLNKNKSINKREEKQYSTLILRDKGLNIMFNSCTCKVDRIEITVRRKTLQIGATSGEREESS